MKLEGVEMEQLASLAISDGTPSGVLVNGLCDFISDNRMCGHIGANYRAIFQERSAYVQEVYYNLT